MIESQRQLEDETPKNDWDGARQTALWYLLEAEKEIAAARSKLGEHPHDNEPKQDVLMLGIIEKVRLARRACDEADNALGCHWTKQTGIPTRNEPDAKDE